MLCKINCSKETCQGELVGRYSPIHLSVIPIKKVQKTMGKQIGRGGSGFVYDVLNSNPRRVYKIIDRNRFDGNEIRIAKIAAHLGIAPAFHSAYLVQEEEPFVLLEMDYAGKSLRTMIEEFENPTDEKMDSEFEGGKKSFSISEDPIDRIYKKREDFLSDLFSKLKKLAENKIAYLDANNGNIIPKQGGLQLIDFGSSLFTKSSADAVAVMLNDDSIRNYFDDFCCIFKDLSSENRDLIRWFKEQERKGLLDESQAI